MNEETIGCFAGKIWQALNEADVLSTKQLQKITKIKAKELPYGLGWLAREGKITFIEGDDNEVLVKLVQN
ncbi:MAG: winged helix-turn-helix domain-containing protein [Bacteroides sp.]|nr:winged helix-turn-helix domain-containing protein [Bacteroides sp.]